MGQLLLASFAIGMNEDWDCNNALSHKGFYSIGRPVSRAVSDPDVLCKTTATVVANSRLELEG